MTRNVTKRFTLRLGRGQSPGPAESSYNRPTHQDRGLLLEEAKYVKHLSAEAGMRKRIAGSVALSTMLTLVAAAQDPKAVIGESAKAMGADSLNAITFSGSATSANFGQTKNISGPYVLSTTTTNYTRTIDLTQPASRVTGTSLTPAPAGAPPAQPVNLNQSIAPNAPWTQQLEIWITPWGFLRGAAANNATVRQERIAGKTFDVVSWMTPQKSPSGAVYTVTGYIDDKKMVDRVETWVEHPILGDLHVEASYSDYKDFGGLKVPGKIVQKRAGWSTFEATIANGAANPPNLAALMAPPAPAAGAAPAAPAAAPPQSQSEKLADGVYRITGGYVSLAVEMKDYVVVLEGGQNEARGLAVIAETKRVLPTSRSGTSSTRMRTSITRAGSRRSSPKASRSSRKRTTRAFSRTPSARSGRS